MTGSTNENAGGDGRTDEALKHIYFYYLMPDSPEGGDAGHIPIKVYFVPRQEASVPDAKLVEELMGQADARALVPAGYAVHDLRWRHPGYLVFAVRGTETKLSGPDAVTFKHLRTVFEDHEVSGPTHQNHSFRHEGDLVLNSGTAVFYRNERKGTHNGPLRKRESDTYEVHFRLQNQKRGDRTHTENGTNTGP